MKNERGREKSACGLHPRAALLSASCAGVVASLAATHPPWWHVLRASSLGTARGTTGAPENGSRAPYITCIEA